MKVSICMCSYQRARQLRNTLESIKSQAYPDLEVTLCEDGDDGGWTRGVCEEYGVRYFQRKNRPKQPYSNPSIPWNIAMRHATGDVLILQNPECEHISPNVIARLAEPHQSRSDLAVFSAVASLDANGRQVAWYCHPQFSARPFFFCGSVRRENVFKIRGFEEDFGRNTGGYGYDDDWFAFCLMNSGVEFSFRDDVLVHHQWHDSTFCYGLESNEALFQSKMTQFCNGDIGPQCNENREWGSLDS